MKKFIGISGIYGIKIENTFIEKAIWFVSISNKTKKYVLYIENEFVF